MKKHTPGPWHLQDNDGAHVCIRGLPSSGFNGQMVAKVWLQDSDFNDYNARLIAMAPDMLSMLEALSLSMVIDQNFDKHQWQTLIRNLINRAKGE